MAERNLNINKDNQILLNKLVEISNGKWSSVASAEMARRMNVAATATKSKSLGRSTAHSMTSFSAYGNYVGAGTNLGNRRRETDRIERENHSFAKRLFQKGAVVKKKKLDTDYQQHLKYLSQIRKHTTG